MARKIKKGTRGPATQFLTRAAALKKLQLSLADFRRLCIFKGVYPRDPKKKLKGNDKTYYHFKDILHLWHEPLINKFRDLKVYDRKVRRALMRKEKPVARELTKRKPVYALYKIIKDRYPTLLTCLRDLDDALCSLALFASLPADDEKGVTADAIAGATRHFDEFLLFVAHQRLVRKVFCSIKGYYVQIKYLGQPIVFLIPHQFPQDLTADVDFKVLLTFLELYQCMVQSVNFKIYQMESLVYPPVADPKKIQTGLRYLALTTQPIKSISSSLNSEKQEQPAEESSSLKVAAVSADDEEKVARLATKLEAVKAKLAKEEEEDEDEEDNQEETEAKEEKEGEEAFPVDETTEIMNRLSEEERKIQELFGGKTFFISRYENRQ